ncbi:MAG: PhnD/SsuA/transferrin family substrate-binding protein [Myxococcota bacterium]
MLALLFPPSLGHVAASARASLLSQWFARQLGVEVDIRVADSYEALRGAIEQGEVDLAWAPPFVCAAVQEHAHTILKASRGGQSMYRSAIIARRGELSTVEELPGRHAAWVDRLSTAGYLLPMARLRGLGYEPDDTFASQSFMGSYGRAVRAVLDRDADLCAVYVRDATTESVDETLVDLVGETDQIHAVDFTAEVPSDGLVVVQKKGHTELEHVVERLRSLSDGRTHTMLLTIFDAEALEPAKPSDYDELRLALR